MNARRHLAAVAVLMLLAACSDGDDAVDTLAPVLNDAADSSAASDAPSTAPPGSAAVSTDPPTSPPPTTAPLPTPPPTAAPTTAPPTAAATTASPTVSPPTEPVASPVVLRADGVADIDFGADPDTAIAAVQAALGDPTDDSGWVDPFTISACPGTEYRRVSWGALSLQFSDSTSAAEGRQHFFGYEYGLVGQTDAEPAGLATPEGVGIGSTVADLRQAYPDVGIAPGEEGVSSPGFEVTEGGLAGLLTDATDDGIVMVLVGGDLCGG